MRPPRSWRPAAALAAAAVLVAVLGWQWRSDAAAQGNGNAPPAVQAALAGVQAGESSAAASRGASASASALAARRQQLALWEQRYMRAEAVYNSYRDATRYPPDSRPLAEHPDQVRPFDPIPEDLPLRDASGKPVKGVRIQTTQERVFLTGAESSRFTIAAVDDNGRPVPLVIERSAAQSLPDTSALISIVHAAVPFSDSGTAGDDVAGDGVYSARLAPAAQGFVNHAGTIRLLVEVSADGQKGVVAFDVVYTSEMPATWAGVREALEQGALNFYLKAQVKTPGRYVASARVYDADGVPFALLQFNDMVPAAGTAEFKLSLAGVLVRDKNPAFPLQLVDVEGFLLRPDTFPDRSMMPRQAGPMHVSRRYSLDSFSGDEWQSEERDRYLAEYGRDVQRALSEIDRLRRN